MYNQNNNILLDILNENIKNIESNLVEQARTLLEEKSLELRNQTDLVIYEEKKQKLLEEKEKIEKSLNDIEDEIFENKRKIEEFQNKIERKNIPENILNAYDKIKTWYSYDKVTEFDYEAMKQLVNNKEILNIQVFKEIKEDTLNIFKLAVDDKERRNIVLTFQDKNWSDLGVKLPTQSLYKDFNVVDWKITMKCLESNLDNK